jgi:prepilin-type N-terminal cleavage/methylation domain-containing protein
MKKPLGFSFVELLVCVTIAAILLALLFINISKSRVNTRVKLQAQELASDLRFTKSLAMAEGTALIDFSASDSYVVKDSSGRIKKRTSIAPDVSLSFPSGSRIFVFSASGAVDHGGTFKTSARGAARTYSVNLTMETGMVTGEN